MTPSTEDEVRSLLLLIRSEGVVAAARDEASQHAGTETMARAVQHVAARWRELADALPAISALLPALRAAADELEAQLGSSNDALETLVVEISGYVEELERASAAREPVQPGTLHALRSAELKLIDEIQRLSAHRTQNEQAVVDNYLALVRWTVDGAQSEYMAWSRPRWWCKSWPRRRAVSM